MADIETLRGKIPGTTITIICKAEDVAFKSVSSRETYNASVGVESLTVRGVFTHDFLTGCYYEVTGKYSISRMKKEIEMYEYHLTYPAEEALRYKMLARLCADNRTADKLMEVCGERVLFMIDETPDDVIGATNWAKDELEEIAYIHKKLREKRVKEPAVRILKKYGVPPEEIVRLLGKHSLGEIARLEQEPYALVEMTKMVDFKTLDKIALNDGYELIGIGRLKAMVLYCMHIALGEEGHTLYHQELVESEFVKMASIPLALNEARGILKTGETSGDAPRRVSIGNTEICMDVKKLRQHYNDWESSNRKTRGEFSYPLLDISERLKDEVFQLLLSQGSIHVVKKADGEFYQLDEFFQYEQIIASNLSSMIREDRKTYTPDVVSEVLENVLHKIGTEIGANIELELEQEIAIKGICGSPYGVFLLTGPAGSGKTFVLKIIIQVLTALRCKYRDLPVISQVLAPTGRAVQVASKAIGEQGATIHRHFRIGPEMFDVYTDNEETLNIVDEFSMVDVGIFAKMMMGIQGVCKLVLVGDPEQLPSVEAGSCLRDLIASRSIPHYHLKTAKRQSAKSGILINANKIIAGESITSEVTNQNTAQDNSYIIQCDKDSDVLEKLAVFIRSIGIERFHKDIAQILCPTKNDAIGVNALNALTQSILNPYVENPLDSEGKGYDRIKSKEEYKGKTLYLQVWDKVINTVNSYKAGIYEENEDGEFIVRVKTGIMNGEIGVIHRIHRVRVAGSMVRRVTVKFNDGYVMYDNANIGNLSLAYAVTIHKSQGSQWPIVISPLVKFSDKVHIRNLLYTMFTRAETTSYLLGKEDSIEKCIQNPALKKRDTGLEEALRDKC